MGEDDILREFVDEDRFSGLYLKEAPAGLKRNREINNVINTGDLSESEIESVRRAVMWGPARKIDAVCIANARDEAGFDERSDQLTFNRWQRIRDKFEGSTVHLFEIKQQLNSKAIGQIITGRYLFKEDNRNNFTVGTTGIICKSSRELFEPVCEDNDIEVFAVG